MEESVWSPIHDREVQPGFSDFEFPEGELTTLRRSSRQKKYICVIGGGIAGLTAAYELLDPAALTPHEVVLVEATGRLGGRIRTWHKDGMTGEFGPMRFPQNHAGTIRYVNSLGLSTGVFIQSNPNAWCQVGGFKYRRSDFDTLLTEYETTHKTQLRNLWIRGSVDPQANMHELLKKQIDGKLRSSPGDDPLKSIARDFDHVSLWQLIRHVDISPRGQIAGPDYIRYSYRPPFGSAPELLTQEQWEVLGRASGMRWTEGMSALEEYVDAYGILGGDERLRLLDGMDALPNKLAEKIIQDREGEIVVNTRVNAVVRAGNAGERCMRVFSDKGEITAADGNAFHYVICAVPASATARMAFVPALRPEKQTALTGLHYRNAAKILLHLRRRIWERGANPIFGGASYTDRLIQQCWYPSDNVTSMDMAGREVPLKFTNNGGFGGYGPYTTLEVYGDPDGWRRPAILTGAYMTGVNADRFISLSDNEKDEAVLSCLEDLHPRIRHDVLDIQHWAWMEQHAPGGGAWVHFDPGEHSRYQEFLAESHPYTDPTALRAVGDGPTVFFAGEHICPLHGWMQSAIHSSANATIKVLKAPPH